MVSSRFTRRKSLKLRWTTAIAAAVFGIAFYARSASSADGVAGRSPR
jgi:hypothetical protein